MNNNILWLIRLGIDGQLFTRDKARAALLSNNRQWHSHGRMIGVGTLTKVVRLKIEDYSIQEIFRSKVSPYNALITDYIAKNKHEFFLHSRCYF